MDPSRALVNPVPLNPAEPAAWCYQCHGLRHFAWPAPGLVIKQVPLHVKGKAAGEMAITLRQGACRDCGAEISRVGGGRLAE